MRREKQLKTEANFVDEIISGLESDSVFLSTKHKKAQSISDVALTSPPDRPTIVSAKLHVRLSLNVEKQFCFSVSISRTFAVLRGTSLAPCAQARRRRIASRNPTAHANYLISRMCLVARLHNESRKFETKLLVSRSSPSAWDVEI